MAPMPSGSYVVVGDGADIGDEGYREATSRHRYQLRTLDELRACFAGLELVEPGLVPVNLWRPAPIEIGDREPVYGNYVTVGRRP